MSVPIRIRDMRESDVAHVSNSWLRSHLDWLRAPFEDRGVIIDPVFSRVVNGAYYVHYGARVRAALARSSTIVACNPEDDDHIYGWACVDGNVMHYAYTKAPLRRFGIASALWREAGRPRVLSHDGRLFEELRHRHQLLYDPEALQCD